MRSVLTLLTLVVCCGWAGNTTAESTPLGFEKLAFENRNSHEIEIVRPAENEWRRTVNGWELVDGWYGRPLRPIHQPPMQPVALAMLQVLISAAVLYAWDKPDDESS